MRRATDGLNRESDLEWTLRARRSLAELVAFLKEQEYGNPVARVREIATAVRRLRRAPTIYQVAHVRAKKEFRRLIVSGRFIVYYIYFPARTSARKGLVSVRSVKHGAQRNPFAGVREPASPGYLSSPDEGWPAAG